MEEYFLTLRNGYINTKLLFDNCTKPTLLTKHLGNFNSVIHLHNSWSLPMLMRSIERQRAKTTDIFEIPMQQYHSILFCSIHGDLLLFEIPPVFFIDQNQVEVILHTELIVYVPVGWSQIIGAQE